MDVVLPAQNRSTMFLARTHTSQATGPATVTEPLPSQVCAASHALFKFEAEVFLACKLAEQHGCS